MKEHITPSRIANAILQDSSFNGHYVFVEGDKDLKLFKKFINSETGRVKITFGKKNMRESYKILVERGMTKIIGIRDADFIRINNKFDANYKDNIFLTDFHDSENMIICSNSFNNFLLECSSQEKLEDFSKRNGDISQFVYDLCFHVSCLRYANKLYNLGLVFKPKTVDSNKVKFKKFICEKTLQYLGDEKLINTLVEYSTNRGTEIKPRDYILEKLIEVKNKNLPVTELSNGHDLAEILFITCKKGLGSSNNIIRDSSSIESMLRLSFSLGDFIKTDLYASLRKWQSNQDNEILAP